MSYSMADYVRESAKKHFKDLTPEEQRQALQDLSPEVRLAGLSPAEIANYLEKLKSEQPAQGQITPEDLTLNRQSAPWPFA